jgi:uncharacterized membrane protein
MGPKNGDERRAPAWSFPCLVAATLIVGALLRIVLIDRQGLWHDEIFSLAMASGHSLEQPARDANPLLGDYVELPGVAPASFYQNYLKNGDSEAGVARVIRAISLSDTSPPLYYLLLHAWTRSIGGSDRALRGFSLVWWVVCFPLVWLIGKEVAGRDCALTACLLFVAAPTSFYYSTEGRMYSMLWFFSLSIMWLTLIAPRTRYQAGVMVLWVLSAAAGLLTHYYFSFILAACSFWLLIHPRRPSWPLVWPAIGTVLLLIIPWYLQIPKGLARWRVSRDWLTGLPGLIEMLISPIRLSLSYFGGWAPADHAALWKSLLFSPLAVVLFILCRSFVSGRLRRDSALLLLCSAAACMGPAVFDTVMKSHASMITRYGLAGMPAAFLLVAAGLQEVRHELRIAVLGILLLAWLPRIYDIFRASSRDGDVYRQIGEYIGDHRRSGDVVIVHSVPSGVLGVARYLPADIEMASWVAQLGNRRVPQDIQALADAHSRVVDVSINNVDVPPPEESWLRANARIVADVRCNSELRYGAGPCCVSFPQQELDPHRLQTQQPPSGMFERCPVSSGGK